MKHTTVSDNHNVLLRPRPQPAAGDLASLLDLGCSGRPAALLAVPAILDEREIDRFASELTLQLWHVAASVTRQVTRFLDLRESDDDQLLLRNDAREGLESRVDGPLQRGRDDQVDVLVMRKRPAEVLALLLAKRRQKRVAQLVVGDIQVVVAVSC